MLVFPNCSIACRVRAETMMPPDRTEPCFNT
jgi:hypothetical protein